MRACEVMRQRGHAGLESPQRPCRWQACGRWILVCVPDTRCVPLLGPGCPCVCPLYVPVQAVCTWAHPKGMCTSACALALAHRPRLRGPVPFVSMPAQDTRMHAHARVLRPCRHDPRIQSTSCVMHATFLLVPGNLHRRARRTVGAHRPRGQQQRVARGEGQAHHGARNPGVHACCERGARYPSGSVHLCSSQRRQAWRPQADPLFGWPPSCLAGFGSGTARQQLAVHCTS